MNPKRAVIDIGTNTFHLLIAQVDEAKNIQVIHKNTIAVKLGEGGINKGFITEAAYQRGMDALIEFRKELNENGLKDVFATATAAVREASNGQDFIDDALAKAEIKITLIDGLKEAEYIYYGAKAAQTLGEAKSLIMDIGGGSVEFIICNENEIFWKNSFRLGAARLLADYYLTDEALSNESLQEIEKLLSKQLVSLFDALKQHRPKKLIGTAGSFDSYASIMALKTHTIFDPEKMSSYHFNINDFQELIDKIIKSTHQERVTMEGLIPLRVDMILMASILTRYIIEKGNIQEVTTCTYSLKEGLLLSQN
jgi:exopolyphosphatase/guanosine-5'-triphosphate,3'-diphosphate pyrophosphatase